MYLCQKAIVVINHTNELMLQCDHIQTKFPARDPREDLRCPNILLTTLDCGEAFLNAAGAIREFL